jgi:uncharacterized protein YigE (DUF2233 family)
VRTGGAWRALWSAGRFPSRADASAALPAGALRWQPVRPGLETAELELRAAGAAWRTRVAIVRLDPARFRLSLALAADAGGTRGAWRVADAPAGAAFACNAGQFAAGLPWGWLVRDGREQLAPGPGPLSSALVVNAAGEVAIVHADSLAARRAAGDVALAFQSYPTVVRRGEVPPEWCAGDPRVDGRHRDARLALGRTREGRLVFALTRLETPGEVLDEVPIGPTSPEMAALMLALECPDAVLLDGGISGQMLVRNAKGHARVWPGLRRVPLALVAFPR